jgi:hypothetical protein
LAAAYDIEDCAVHAKLARFSPHAWPLKVRSQKRRPDGFQIELVEQASVVVEDILSSPATFSSRDTQIHREEPLLQ